MVSTIREDCPWPTLRRKRSLTLECHFTKCAKERFATRSLISLVLINVNIFNLASSMKFIIKCTRRDYTLALLLKIRASSSPIPSVMKVPMVWKPQWDVKH